MATADIQFQEGTSKFATNDSRTFGEYFGVNVPCTVTYLWIYCYSTNNVSYAIWSVATQAVLWSGNSTLATGWNKIAVPGGVSLSAGPLYCIGYWGNPQGGTYENARSQTAFTSGSLTATFSDAGYYYAGGPGSFPTMVASGPTANVGFEATYTPPNQPPNTPTSLTPASGAATKSTGSLAVSAVVSDPDGNNVAAFFEYSTNNSTWTRVQGSTVASGGTSTATLTGLATNTMYYLRAQASDTSSALSAYTATNTFYTDRPPTAPTITAPNGGEVINASTTITWTAGTDPDGDTPVYDLDYSQDNGATWVNIATGVSGTSYAWNTSGIAASTACLVRARSKDPQGLTSAYDQSNAVFTIQHNTAPNPATWVSPAAGSTLDRAISQTLTFQFNDPDTGDVLTKFDYRYRLVGAGTWTTTGTVTGSTPQLVIPANTLAAGNYEFQVLTYDGQGVAATGWSTSLNETFATAPAAPSITTPASGATVGTQNGVAAWTVGTQTGYQVQRVADNVGAMADPSVPANVYQDTGQVTGAGADTARNTALSFPVNNRYEWIRVRIQAGGLWSAWASVRYLVSWTAPAVPALVIAQLPPDALRVTVTNPTPGGTQPTVARTEIFRQALADRDGAAITGPDAVQVRVANLTPSAQTFSFDDHQVASGTVYRYQAVTLGNNGTQSYSDWVQ